MRSRLMCALFLTAAGAARLAAQATIPWDSSGNGMLKGACSFREVAFVAADSYGDIGRALAVWGTITFDGNGNYSVNGQILDSASGGPQSYTNTGTYAISSGGWGYITSLLVSGEVVTGLVSQGVFIGSNINSAVLNNFMMVVPSAPTTAGNSLLTGNYWLATLNFPSTYPELANNGLALISADGKGNLNQPISMSGYVGTSGSTVVTQSISGAHYSFASGVATLSFPASSSSTPLISGDKLTYISPDGNFFIGGSTSAFDIVAGVRTDTTAVPASMIQGLYYTAGLADDESAVASSGYARLYGYYGSMNANGSGTVLEHEEISPFDASTYNLTTNDTYAANSDGSFNTSVLTFGAGSGGGSLMGITRGPVIGILAALRSPYFSGSGVYLNPTGIVNAASSAPFTAGISRGEFLTLYGTNLAPSEAMAQVPFPAQLNGVQVTINGRSAPVYYVSPSQVSVIVPYATELSNAQIQVTNNGAASNMVTTLVKLATPGLFTVPPGGTGYGAILHTDFSLVTTDHPALAGETVLVYLTGLGDVSPAVTEGTAAPSNPTANVVAPLGVYFTNTSGATAGTVSYSGLAPGFAGLYQINVQIPTGLTSGDYHVEVGTPNSYATQALIPVR